MTYGIGMPAVLKDLKEGLSSARKADITHVRLPFMIYTARPCEYGSVKYERSNFMRPVSSTGYTGTPTPADFERFRAYLRAAASHIFETLHAMERHQATDYHLQDVEGMKRAAYAVDTDTTPGAKVGASLLPHIAPACASLNMAITQAVECGLLPADPGTPWVAAKATPPEPPPLPPPPCPSNECGCTGERRVPRDLTLEGAGIRTGAEGMGW